MTKVYFHTSGPSPYRKHLFELLARELPGCVFLFSLPFQEDRTWVNSFDGWMCECRWALGWREIKELALQRWGTVHVLGCCWNRTYRWLLLFSALIRHSRVLLWDDARLADQIASMDSLPPLRKVRRRIFVSMFVGIFTAGKLGALAAKKIGFDEGRIINTYFSHDVDKFWNHWIAHREDDRSRIRQQLKIDEGKICLLNISRYLELKRLVDLAEALLLVERQNPNLASKCELILIGDGASKDHIPLLAKLKIIKVHLVKQMPPDEVLAYYCAADLFVFPSEGDIWGLVVNEALSMGVPVICTERIGASEMVVDGENGYVVPIRCPQLISDRIIRYLGDQQLRERLKMNAVAIRNKWRSEFGVAALKRYLVKLGAF